MHLNIKASILKGFLIHFLSVDKEDVTWHYDYGNPVEREDNGTSLEEKKRILQLANDHPKWSLKTIQGHGGSALPYHSYKSRWEKQIAEGGMTSEKYDVIDDHVLQKFEEARNDG